MRDSELLKRIFFLKKILELTRKLMSLKTNVDLHPLVKRQADKIITEMARLGHPVRIVQGYRSIEEQNRLYAQGRTTTGSVVTNAKGGQSFHNYGVAVDMVFVKEGWNATESLWQLLGKVGKAQGFEWGGDWTGFVDRPHFEMKLGYSLSDFQGGKVDYSKFK
jgi:peptidoglycan L-alanyl-D-glutamate endopeptidase CwlK